jgi:hypothetical protein
MAYTNKIKPSIEIVIMGTNLWSTKGAIWYKIKKIRQNTRKQGRRRFNVVMLKATLLDNS